MSNPKVILLLEDKDHNVRAFKKVFENQVFAGSKLSVRHATDRKEMEALIAEFSTTPEIVAVGVFDLQVPGNEHEAGDGYSAHGVAMVHLWEGQIGRPWAVWTSFLEDAKENRLLNHFGKGELPELTFWLAKHLV